jgi:hypothetical protein
LRREKTHARSPRDHADGRRNRAGDTIDHLTLVYANGRKPPALRGPEFNNAAGATTSQSFGAKYLTAGQTKFDIFRRPRSPD